MDTPSEDAKKLKQKESQRRRRQALIKKDVDDINEFKPSRVRTKLHVKKLTKKKERFVERVKHKARAEILNKQNDGYLRVDDDDEDGETDVPTYAIKQREIVDNVDIATATKHFNLDLDHGPYQVDYTPNGRHLLIAGKDGHLAAFDWQTKHLHTEVMVNERISAIKWLHNENMFAAAQKRWTHIYDRNGTELHCIKALFDVHSLDFLPRHFLLVAMSRTDYLTYLDVSTGAVVSSHRIKQKNATCMTQNSANAIIVSGDSKGVVAMWSPNSKDALVTMLTHRAPVSGVAIDATGNYMATVGLDNRLKIWDVRKYDELYSNILPSPPTHVAFSQTRCVATAFSRDVHVYNEATSGTLSQPYMRYATSREVSALRFCPYEDVLGIGHAEGFASILVPASGDPNFDALHANPFESKRQRQEREVRQLLEKIQPSMITLNPIDIVRVNQASLKSNMEHRDNVMHWKNAKVDVNPSRFFRPKKTLK